MEDNNWSIEFTTNEGLKLRYEWREFFDSEGDSIGHWGALFDPETGEETDLEHDLKESFKAAASAFRVSELRRGLKLNSIDMFSDESKKKAILDLFYDSQRGKYIGQTSHNSLVYVQDISELLRLNLRVALRYFQELIEEKKIGLNGMILTSYSTYEESRVRQEKQTGHKSISISDFGYWYCATCKQRGDDYSDPSDYKCE